VDLTDATTFGARERSAPERSNKAAHLIGTTIHDNDDYPAPLTGGWGCSG
jgi:hypothetical protein